MMAVFSYSKTTARRFGPVWVLTLGLTVAFLAFFGAARAAVAGPIPQTPDNIQVDYAVENNQLVLMLATRPPISGCGKISNLPIRGDFDRDAVDLTVGPYAFIPAPSGTRGRACGPAYKVSVGRVSIPLAEITGREISRIRLWSGTQMDAFAISVQEGTLNLDQIEGAGFFKLGQRKTTVPESFTRLRTQQ